MSGDFRSDPLLQNAWEVEGFKVLYPVVLTAKLGQGGMGTVYRGRHLKLDIDVAVKCLRPGLAQENEEFVQRFRREATVAASIDSENLVRVFDVHESRGIHYLVMEFVPGETIRERVNRVGHIEPSSAAVTIIYEAARGLAQAHKMGIVHRDIKPDNIMIADHGRIKVADLGLAKVAESLDGLETRSGLMMGTPNYMPPEQYADAKSLTPAADVYSLALTLYYMLTGHHAVPSGSLVDVMRRVCDDPLPDLALERPDLEDGVIDFYRRAIDKNPSKRPQSGVEVISLLAPYRNRKGEEQLARGVQMAGDRPDRTTAIVPTATMQRIRDAVQSNSDLQSIPGTIVPPLSSTIPPTMAPRAPSDSNAATRMSRTVVPSGARHAPVRRGRTALVLFAFLFLIAAGSGFAAWKLGWIGSNVGEYRARFDEGVADIRRPATLDRGVTTLLRVKKESPDYPGLDAELRPALLVLGQRQLEDGNLGRAYELCREALSIDEDAGGKELSREIASAITQALGAALKIERPKSGAILPDGRASILGSVDLDRLYDFGLDQSQLEVNGDQVKISGGQFRSELVLPEGGHQISIRLIAFGDSAAEIELNLRSDSRPPVMAIAVPAQGAHVRENPVSIIGSYQDATTCRVSLSITGPTNRNVNAMNSAGDTLGIPWNSVVALDDGSYRIKATATDETKKSTTIERAFVVDTKQPDIFVDAFPKTLIETSLSVACGVMDTNLETVELAGKPVTVDIFGRFTRTLSLVPGVNKFELVATDRAGNVRRKSIETFRETAAVCADRAAKQLAEMDVVKALESLNRALEIDSKSIRARRMRGALLSIFENMEEAYQDLTFVLDDDKGQDATTYSNRAVVKWWLEASQAYRQGSTRLVPASALVQMDLEDALRQDAKDAAALSNLIALKAVAGDSLADSDLAKRASAVTSGLTTAIVNNNIGYAEAKQGRHREAIVFFDRAIADDGKFSQAWLNRAVSKMAIQDAAGAYRDYLQALKFGGSRRSKKRPMPWFSAPNLGSEVIEIVVTLGAPPSAELVNNLLRFSRAKHLDGDYAEARRGYLGVPSLSLEGQIWHIKAALADPGGASGVIGAAISQANALSKDKALPAKQRAEIRRLLGIARLEGALRRLGPQFSAGKIRDLTAAIADYDQPGIRLQRALQYIEKKNYRDARADLDHILKREPYNSRALALRSDCHDKLKSKTAAYIDARQSIALFPNQKALLKRLDKWFVIMHQGQYRSVRWILRPSWPKPLKTLDDRNQKEGYYVNYISHGADRWAVFDTQAKGFQQRTEVSKAFPAAWIKKRWDEKYVLETGGWSGSEHTVVMRKFANSNQIGQSYKPDSVIPSDWIKKKAKDGYELTAMWPISTTQKVFVMKKFPNRTRPIQSWETSKTFPRGFFNAKSKAGQRPHLLLHDGVNWLAVATADKSLKNHRILESLEWPKALIKAAWKERFHLVASARGPDLPEPSSYSRSAYDFFNRREWRKARSAIEAQARSDQGNQHPYLLMRRLLIDLRTGTQLDAVQTKAALYRAETTLALDKWSRTVMNYFAGDLSEKAFIRLAAKDREHRCEAYYYVAQFRRARGDLAATKSFLLKCVAEKVTTFTEHTSATAELKLLK
ncbi:MAG: protein kinase [Planctomycetota bacterium]